MTLVRSWMRSCVWLLLAVLTALPAMAVGVFDIDDRSPQRIIITAPDTSPDLSGPRSPMLDMLRGLVAELSPEDIRALRASAAGTPSGRVPRAEDVPPPLFVAHCTSGEHTRKVGVSLAADGLFVAVPLDAPGKPAILHREKFQRLAGAWSTYRGAFRAPDGPAQGVIAPLPGEIGPCWFAIDKETLGDRFLNGRSTSIAPAVRNLQTEEFLLRLPRGFDVRHPCGVLVWIDPRDRTTLDLSLFAACDELGVILIGATVSGNQRPTADRFQLALDAIGILRTRYLVDDARIYASGLSGGGKISTHLWACFPDVFTGAVPIVGLASYKNIPTGTGQFWPGDFEKPRDRERLTPLLRHRCAAVTGDRDFNYAPILGTAKMMQADGLHVQVFDIPAMAHEFPTAEQFAMALRWVDEPARLAHEKDIQAAQAAWAKLLAADAPAPGTPERRDALAAITAAAPWSSEAWRAAIELGVATPSPK